ncbi:unnamed protein product [Lupinus luteus]|uniref:Uncharacterized protein n=1 Tax=Lupinus luteus TaxID=3873 RepID=A0AAV1XEL0_LUPLU
MAHLFKKENGLTRGMVKGEASNDNVISGRVGLGDGVEDGESVVHGVGEDEGGGLEEVCGDGGAVDEAGFDEVGVELVEVGEGFALVEDYGFWVRWEVGNGGYGSWGFGREYRGSNYEPMSYLLDKYLLLVLIDF